MAGKKIKKVTARNFWGERITTSYVDGRKIGYTKHGQGFFGDVSTHHKVDGQKVGYTKHGQGWTGRVSTRHRTDGHKVGYSVNKTDWLGKPYTTHHDLNGSKLDSKERGKWFADDKPKHKTSSSEGWFSSGFSGKRPEQAGLVRQHLSPNPAPILRTESKPISTTALPDMVPVKGGGDGGVGGLLALGIIGLFFCFLQAATKEESDRERDKDKKPDLEPQPFLNFHFPNPEPRDGQEVTQKEFLARREDYLTRLYQDRASRQRAGSIRSSTKQGHRKKNSDQSPLSQKMFPRPRPTYMCPERKDRPRPYVPKIYVRRTPGEIIGLVAPYVLAVCAAIVVVMVGLAVIGQ